MKNTHAALSALLGDKDMADKFILTCQIQGKNPRKKLREMALTLIWFHETLLNPPSRKRCNIVFKTAVNEELWNNFKKLAKQEGQTISQLFCALVKDAPFYLEALNLDQTRKRDTEKRIPIGIKIDQESFDILENFSRHFSKKRGQIGGQILDNCRLVLQKKSSNPLTFVAST